MQALLGWNFSIAGLVYSFKSGNLTGVRAEGSGLRFACVFLWMSSPNVGCWHIPLKRFARHRIPQSALFEATREATDAVRSQDDHSDHGVTFTRIERGRSPSSPHRH